MLLDGMPFTVQTRLLISLQHMAFGDIQGAGETSAVTLLWVLTPTLSPTCSSSPYLTQNLVHITDEGGSLDLHPHPTHQTSPAFSRCHLLKLHSLPVNHFDFNVILLSGVYERNNEHQPGDITTNHISIPAGLLFRSTSNLLAFYSTFTQDTRHMGLKRSCLEFLVCCLAFMKTAC